MVNLDPTGIRSPDRPARYAFFINICFTSNTNFFLSVFLFLFPRSFIFVISLLFTYFVTVS